MLHTTGLKELIFDSHLFKESDEFTVISGYVTCSPIQQLAELPENVHVTVIYGMYGEERIPSRLHRAILNLQLKLKNVDILYCTVPVHSKIYFWRKTDGIKKALIGSANFTRYGLENDYREVLADADQESFVDYDDYFNFIMNYCLPCTDSSIETRDHKIPFYYKLGRYKQRMENVHRTFMVGGDHNQCLISLLNESGEVNAKSGLNWGLSSGHTAVNDAYIAIPIELVRQRPNLFPPKKVVFGYTNEDSKGRKNRENDEIEIIWDDGTTMNALLEGSAINSSDKMVYPKQLSSSPRKSIMGEYLRKRLGVSSEHCITRADLEAYGRTDVFVELISEGVYFIDFSVKKRK